MAPTLSCLPPRQGWWLSISTTRDQSSRTLTNAFVGSNANMKLSYRLAGLLDSKNVTTTRQAHKLHKRFFRNQNLFWCYCAVDPDKPNAQNIMPTQLVDELGGVHQLYAGCSDRICRVSRHFGWHTRTYVPNKGAKHDSAP